MEERNKIICKEIADCMRKVRSYSIAVTHVIDNLFKAEIEVVAADVSQIAEYLDRIQIRLSEATANQQILKVEKPKK